MQPSDYEDSDERIKFYGRFLENQENQDSDARNRTDNFLNIFRAGETMVLAWDLAAWNQICASGERLVSGLV